MHLGHQRCGYPVFALTRQAGKVSAFRSQIRSRARPRRRPGAAVSARGYRPAPHRPEGQRPRGAWLAVPGAGWYACRPWPPGERLARRSRWSV